MSKTAPNYGPVVGYYKGPYGNNDLEYWNKIHGGANMTGGLGLDVNATARRGDGSISLYGVTD